MLSGPLGSFLPLESQLGSAGATASPHLGQRKKAGIAPGPHPIDGVLIAQLAPCPGAGSPYLRFPQELPLPSRMAINSSPVISRGVWLFPTGDRAASCQIGPADAGAGAKPSCTGGQGRNEPSAPFQSRGTVYPRCAVGGTLPAYGHPRRFIGPCRPFRLDKGAI